ncbi:MAG: hypothetical protein LBS14_02990 [Holosporaceae bacterium]|nr:hypothetical protein [Holosporaceae bacterium]
MSGCLVVLVEFMFGLSMFTNAVLFIPQALKVYKTKDTGGLSVVTFAGFNFIQIVTIAHAYIHRDWILMGGYIFSLVFSGFTTALILKYKKQ